jgi:REP element-mobilizing transposase RayT
MKMTIENSYLVNINWDTDEENSNHLETIQDVIEYITDIISAYDDNSCFAESEIHVFNVDNDGEHLIISKSTNDSMSDFISDLAQLSSDNKEEEIRSVLEWLNIIERNLSLSYKEGDL